MVFQHLCHKTVDPAPHIGQKHQYVGAVVSPDKRALNRIHLSPVAADASNQLLLFLLGLAHVLNIVLSISRVPPTNAARATRVPVLTSETSMRVSGSTTEI